MALVSFLLQPSLVFSVLGGGLGRSRGLPVLLNLTKSHTEVLVGGICNPTNTRNGKSPSWPLQPFPKGSARK